MALVDDAHRHQHHAGANVEGTREQKVDVGLFEFQFARFLEPFDEGMRDLKFTNEANAVAIAMRDQQDKSMEVQLAVKKLGLVVVRFHVARQQGPGLLRGRRRRRGLGQRRAGQSGGEDDSCDNS